MLCTSGFVDDVMFSHNRPYVAGDAIGVSTALIPHLILKLIHQGVAPVECFLLKH